MNFEKKVRINLNNILYHLNKYNVVGGVLAYFVAYNLNAIGADKNKFMKKSSHLISILLIVSVFIIFKELMHYVMGIPEKCECKKDVKTIVEKIRECGNNEGIVSSSMEIGKVLFNYVFDFTIKYNLLSFVMVILLGSITGSIIRTGNLFQLYPMSIILFSLVISKLFFKVFFESQNFCPCDCKKNECKLARIDPKTLKNELENDFTGKSDIKKELEQNVSNKLGKKMLNFKGLDYKLSDLDKELEDETNELLSAKYDYEKIMNKDLTDRVSELEKLKPSNSKLSSDSLIDVKIKELCGKNKRFKVVDTNINPEKCLAVITQNKSLNDFVKLFLEDTNTYNCIKGSTSSSAINSCIEDYVIQNPRSAKKLVNDYLEIELEELEKLINDKYPSYKKEPKKQKSVEELEAEIKKLKKMLNDKNFFFSTHNKTKNLKNEFHKKNWQEEKSDFLKYLQKNKEKKDFNIDWEGDDMPNMGISKDNVEKIQKSKNIIDCSYELVMKRMNELKNMIKSEDFKKKFMDTMNHMPEQIKPLVMSMICDNSMYEKLKANINNPDKMEKLSEKYFFEKYPKLGLSLFSSVKLETKNSGYRHDGHIFATKKDKEKENCHVKENGNPYCQNFSKYDQSSGTKCKMVMDGTSFNCPRECCNVPDEKKVKSNMTKEELINLICTKQKLVGTNKCRGNLNLLNNHLDKNGISASLSGCLEKTGNNMKDLYKCFDEKSNYAKSVNNIFGLNGKMILKHMNLFALYDQKKNQEEFEKLYDNLDMNKQLKHVKNDFMRTLYATKKSYGDLIKVCTEQGVEEKDIHSELYKCFNNEKSKNINELKGFLNKMIRDELYYKLNLTKNSYNNFVVEQLNDVENSTQAIKNLKKFALELVLSQYANLKIFDANAIFDGKIGYDTKDELENNVGTYEALSLLIEHKDKPKLMEKTVDFFSSTIKYENITEQLEKYVKLLNKNEVDEAPAVSVNGTETETFINYEYNVNPQLVKLSKNKQALADPLIVRIRKNCEKNRSFYQTTDKLPLFSNVAQCVDFIVNNDYLRDLYKNILMEKDMYSCVVNNNTNNINECLFRYFADYPAMLNKVIGLEEELKRGDDITQKKLLDGFKKMLEKDYDYVSALNRKHDNGLEKYYPDIKKSEKVKLETPFNDAGEPDYNDPYNLNDQGKLDIPVVGNEFIGKLPWIPNKDSLVQYMERNDETKIFGNEKYVSMNDL